MARSTAARIRAYQQYLDEVERSLDSGIQEATRKMTAKEKGVRDQGGMEMEAILQDKATINKRREAIQKRLDRGEGANGDGQLPTLYQSFVSFTGRRGDADIDEEGWVEQGAEGDGFWDMRLEEDPEHEVKAAAAKKISVLRQQEAELEERVKALQAKNRNFAEKIEELAAADRKELRVRRQCLQTECEGGIGGTAAQKKQWNKIVQQYLGETYKIRVNAEWRKIAGKEREALKRAGSPEESGRQSKRRRSRNTSAQDDDLDDDTETIVDSGVTTPAVTQPATDANPSTTMVTAEQEDDAADNGSDSFTPEVAETRERRRPRKKLRSINQNDTKSRSTTASQPPAKSKRSRKSMTGGDDDDYHDDDYQDDSEQGSSPPLRRLTRGRARRRVSVAQARESQGEEEMIEPPGAEDPAQGEDSSRDEEQEQEQETDAAMEELGPDHQALLDARERGESGADYALKFNLKIALAHEFLEESDLIVKSRSGEWVELHCPICKGNTQAPGELAFPGFNFFRNHLDIVHDINEPDDQELVELCTKRTCHFEYLRDIVKGGVKPAAVLVKAPGEVDEEEQEQDEVDTGSAAGEEAKSDVADAGDDGEQDVTVAPTWDFSTLG